MLGAMRRHSKSFIIYLLFAMIIVVFVFTFNTGSSKSGGCNPPEAKVYANVGSNSITQDDLMMGMGLIPTLLRAPPGETAKEREMVRIAVQMEVFLLASGADITALRATDLEDLPPETANAYLRVVEMFYLAADEARRLGFNVGGKELARAMYPERYYEEKDVEGEDGIETKKVFKEKEFNNWIVYGLHSSAKEYEAFVETVLLAFKLQQFISGVVTVETLEAELAARAKGTKVNLDYAEFRPAMFDKMAVATPKEVAGFQEEKEEQIKEYYDLYPTRFHSEAGYQLAGIYVAAGKEEKPGRGEEQKEPKPPSAEEKEAALKRARAIRDRLDGKVELFKGGRLPMEIDPTAGTLTINSKDLEIPEEPLQRFKEVAKRESDHAETKARSGLFNELMNETAVAAGPLGENVSAALVDAKKDQLVGPVETETGFWLVYVQDVREKIDLSLEQAMPEIAETLLKEEKAPELAKVTAEEFRKVLAASADLDMREALDEFKKNLDKGEEENSPFALLRVQPTGNFYLSTPRYDVPGIDEFEELFKYSFKMALDKPVADKVFVNPETKMAYVVKLADRTTPPDTLDEDTIKGEKLLLSYSRDVPYFQSWLKSLRQSALEKGELQRTQDFQDFLTSLQLRKEETEQRAAKRAAKKKAE